ncbi:hypothetical protein N7414_30535 [Pseudomonas sp. GD04087]|uniref:hypothetical protein n=1 Tax=unclassified Pseudomonas TaxID=196821 RepID=UPI002449A71E|nr:MULTISPECIES: hypothetical protein [unclassified Pseudomonas]MDH0293478.1 hypothetical protein [Pseudomonas sp. GD04087]MDH1053058.1 hypothetical protein [Pseudomonas sp. GD03903]
MMLYNKVLLVEDYIKIYEQKLIAEFGLDLEVVEGTARGIAPIVYASILNKKVSARPRQVEIAATFDVPPEYARTWNALRAKIEQGDDLSAYLSKDHTNWSKADFLLYCSNIHHIHLTTRRGVGTNDELVYGIFKDDKFFAIHFGGHRDIYRIEDFYAIAEDSWPGQLFKTADDGAGSSFYERRMVTDPTRHMNILKPAGHMAGHQRTHLISLTDGEAEIKNVALEVWLVFSNEVDYLTELEDRFSKKYGYLAQLKLHIDFDRQRYIVISEGVRRYVFEFPKKALTVSKTVAKFFA